MGIFPAPWSVKTPTDIASHETGEGGVLAVREDGWQGSQTCANRWPKGLCRIGGVGKVQEGAQRPPDVHICLQIRKCPLPFIEGAASPMLTYGNILPQTSCQRWAIDPCRRHGGSACELHHAHRCLPRSDRLSHMPVPAAGERGGEARVWLNGQDFGKPTASVRRSPRSRQKKPIVDLRNP